MNWLIGITIVTVLVAIFVVFIRPGMRNNPRFATFFQWIEPVEIAGWRKSETLLWARMKMVIGVLLTMLMQLGTIDITPLLPLISEDYQFYVAVVWNLLPMAITAVGWVDERLRYDTTKPIELVSVTDRETRDNPAVAEAVHAAEVVKHEAVAVVNAAKGEAPAPPTKGTG